MISESKHKKPLGAVAVELDVPLETASERLLDMLKGSTGGFERMTMTDARCIAQIIRRRIGES